MYQSIGVTVKEMLVAQGDVLNAAHYYSSATLVSWTNN